MSTPVKRSRSEDDLNDAVQPDKIRLNGLTWTKHPDFYFKDGSLTLLVDDYAYRVHASVLALHSVYWKDELGDYDVDQLEPKELEDILSHEIAAFLAVMYSRDFDMYGLTSIDEWTSVLRLASLWDSQGIHDLAIEVLDRSVSSYRRLVLARQHDLQDWIEPAFEALSQRAEPLSVNEAKNLSIEDVIRITTARENALALDHELPDAPEPQPVELPPLPKITSKFTREELEKVSIALPYGTFADIIDLVTAKKLPAFYHALEDFTDIYSKGSCSRQLVSCLFAHSATHPPFLPLAVEILSSVSARVGTGKTGTNNIAENIQVKVDLARSAWARMEEASAKYPDFNMALRSATSAGSSRQITHMLGYNSFRSKGPANRKEYEERSANLRRFIEALCADDVGLAR